MKHNPLQNRLALRRLQKRLQNARVNSPKQEKHHRRTPEVSERGVIKMLDRKTVTALVNKYLEPSVSIAFREDWKIYHEQECAAVIESFLQGDKLTAEQIYVMVQMQKRSVAK